MEARGYAAAKALVDRAEKQDVKLDDLPDDPLINLVYDIEFDIAKEARLRRGN